METLLISKLLDTVSNNLVEFRLHDEHSHSLFNIRNVFPKLGSIRKLSYFDQVGSSGGVTLIASYRPHLIELDLSHCQFYGNLTKLDVSDTGISKSAFMRLPADVEFALEVLRIHDNRSIDDAVVRVITASFPKLQEICVSKCRSIAGSSLPHLLSQCRQLRTMRCHENDVLNFNHFPSSERHANVTALDISKISCVHDHIMRDIVLPIFPSLLELGLAFNRITDKAIADVCKALPNLTALDVRVNRNLTNAALTIITLKLPHLQRLCLSLYAEGMTYPGLLILKSHRQLAFLSLTLSMRHPRDDLSIMTQLVSSVTTLRELVLTSSFPLNYDFQQVLTPIRRNLRVTQKLMK